ncbi:hypothetical protein BaRGS_00016030 [Batillaria attramentaria]|uniref:C2H2-type domain-containing protein n=1 Tax=Batillaria attramentaria TaxID=370345 RepID=A0ABD0KZR7_9CAEN
MELDHWMNQTFGVTADTCSTRRECVFPQSHSANANGEASSRSAGCITSSSSIHSDLEFSIMELSRWGAVKSQPREESVSKQIKNSPGATAGAVNNMCKQISQESSLSQAESFAPPIKTEPLSPKASLPRFDGKRHHTVGRKAVRKRSNFGVFPLALFQNVHSSGSRTEVLDADAKPEVHGGSADVEGLNPSEKPFVCSLCGKGFVAQYFLTKHTNLHYPSKKTFQCSVCSSSFWKKTMLMKHVCVVTTKRGAKQRFQCDYCTSTFASVVNLRKHTAGKHAGEKPFQCLVCRHCFSHDAYLQSHIKRSHRWVHSLQDLATFHTGADALPTQCPSPFKSKRSSQRQAAELAEEKETEMGVDCTSVRSFRCKECPSAFSTKVLMLKHVETHKRFTPYKCAYCPQRFATPSKLKAHAAVHKGKVFRCLKCTFIFLKQASLYRHLAEDHGEKPYKCNQCSRQFSNKNRLTIHTRIHASEKPFKCPDCPLAFTTRTVLKRHLKRHGDMKFRCSKCNHWFMNLERLQRHFRRHTGEVCFLCSQCPSSFNSLFELEVHARKHTQHTSGLGQQRQSPSPGSSNLGELKLVIKRTDGNSFTCCMPSPLPSPSIDADVDRQSLISEQAHFGSAPQPQNSSGLGYSACSVSQEPHTLPAPGIVYTAESYSQKLRASSGVRHSAGSSSQQLQTASTTVDLGASGLMPGATTEPFPSCLQLPSCLGIGASGLSRITVNTEYYGPCLNSQQKSETVSSSENSSVDGVSAIYGENQNVPMLEGPVFAGTRMLSTRAPRVVLEHLPCPQQLKPCLSDSGVEEIACHKEQNAPTTLLPSSSRHQPDQKTVLTAASKTVLKPGPNFPADTFNQQTQCPMRRDPGERPHKCLVCSSTFKYPSDLKVHARVHTGEKPFKCSQCPRAFKSMSELTSHTKTHTDRKPFKCSQCSSSFLCPSDLKIHSRIHSGERPYQCAQCPRAFKSVSELKSHSKTHSEEKPFRCSDCTSSFRRMSDLKVHIRIHSGEKPYLCSQCASAFKSVGELNSHTKTHTDNRPHKCSVCPSAFRSASDLKVHTRTHTGERPYLCSQCPSAFKSVGELKSHTRRTHPEEKPSLVLSGDQ